MDPTQPDRRAAWAAAFEGQRPYLRSVAYRMLGSLAEADDALQECWLRLDRSGPAREEDLRPWLTTVLSRICLDLLRSRRSRKEQYAGSWLPEPLVVADASPEAASVQADSVGLALLIVLETLTPAERLAFVLHEVFGLPFGEIAPIVGRSPTATRQLASRARRRVRAAKPEPEADLAVERRVVDAFLAAARGGDFAGLLAVLDPEVVLRTDGGGRGPLARPPLTGAPEVAGRLLAQASSFAPFCRPATVNGRAGFVVGPPGRILGVVGFRVAAGRITEVDIIGDPSKLRGVTLG
ncbi:MAG: RNA polymerase sigma factor SigJ [Candidatus Limnocylindrales bacterium]